MLDVSVLPINRRQAPADRLVAAAWYEAAETKSDPPLIQEDKLALLPRISTEDNYLLKASR
jgi:hypothetical protein